VAKYDKMKQTDRQLLYVNAKQLLCQKRVLYSNDCRLKILTSFI